MGLFDGFGTGTGAGGAAAGGDWATQAADAQKLADEMMRSAGYADGTAGVTMANAADVTADVTGDRARLDAQGHEQNRILTVGSPATITIAAKTDTGERVAGNIVFRLDLDVQPEGGETYRVQKSEIIPPTVLEHYADGTTMPGRIDPADREKVAFGDKPFM